MTNTTATNSTVVEENEAVDEPVSNDNSTVTEVPIVSNDDLEVNNTSVTDNQTATANNTISEEEV